MVFPFSRLWFCKMRHFRSKSYFQSKLERALAASRDISEQSRVLVEIVGDGLLSSHTVRLTGTVGDASEREAAQAIVTSHVGGMAGIVNDIRVADR